jgi:DNA-binding response OmpR family regulator
MSEHGVDPPVAHSAVRRLRRKLCSAGAGVTIESVRGYGFRLVRLDNRGACHRTAEFAHD